MIPRPAIAIGLVASSVIGFSCTAGDEINDGTYWESLGDLTSPTELQDYSSPELQDYSSGWEDILADSGSSDDWSI